MNWRLGELREVKVKVTRKRKNRQSHESKTHKIRIPAPYDRIIAQMNAEHTHANIYRAHEAIRRQSYVNECLDEFAREILEYKGPAIEFRSKVLTPILQRQLQGVPDAYGPGVSNAMLDEGEKGPPTILQATQFYLSLDPTDPTHIPMYRRNLVYIPEARWHLCVVMGKTWPGFPDPYNRVLRDQDVLAKAFEKENQAYEDEEDEESDDPSDVINKYFQDLPDIDQTDIPVFSQTEVMVILNERLEAFFRRELSRVVCFPFPSLYHVHCLTCSTLKRTVFRVVLQDRQNRDDANQAAADKAAAAKRTRS